MNIFIDGWWSNNKPVSSKEGLVFVLIEQALGVSLDFVSNVKDAELIVLYPFLGKGRKIAALLRKEFLGTRFRDPSVIFGLPKHIPILAVAHENLDHRTWYWFGKLIRELNIPRLTFWPKQVDPEGGRFPYWWNYVSFDEYQMYKNVYSRFGVPMDLELLMSPLKADPNRKDAICVLTRHQRWPRNNEIAFLEKFKEVHVYQQGSHREWSGSKFELLSQYKYAFAAENSTGYGYQTEKLPEAWVAGCIPVGYAANPFGDFNFPSTFLPLDQLEEYCISTPLLSVKPDLDSVISYIRTKLSHHNNY